MTNEGDVRDVYHQLVPNEGGGVAPRTMLDGRRPDFSLEVLEKVRYLSTLCGESKILRVSKLEEDEFSSSIGRSDSELRVTDNGAKTPSLVKETGLELGSV